VGNNSSGQRGTGHPYRKAVFWLAIPLLAAAGYGAYYTWTASHKKPQYVTGDVTMGDVERSVNVTGSINPRNTVQVGSYVSGTIKSMSCDFNTEVKAGQVCAKIDPSTFQVAVDQAEAQLNSSRAQLKKDEAALAYAKGVFDRDNKLLKDGVIAQEIADNDKSAFRQATAQIDLDKAAIVAQEASLKSAVVNLGYTNIVSPVNGTVLTRNVDVGQTVASSLQTPTLFLIGKDLTKMQVDANVSEADVGRIQVGQDVTFSVQAYPDKEFDGVVKQIRRGPITVQNVVTYDVVVAVDNPELLLFPGMTADAEIVTDSREKVLRVPLAATRYTPEHAHGEGLHGGNRGDGRSDSAAEKTSNTPSSGKHEHGSSNADKPDDKKVAPAKEAASGSASASATVVAATSTDGTSAAAEEQGSDCNNSPWPHHGDHGGEHRGEHRGDFQGAHNGEHRNWHREQSGDQSNAQGGDQANAGSDGSAEDGNQHRWQHRSNRPDVNCKKDLVTADMHAKPDDKTATDKDDKSGKDDSSDKQDDGKSGAARKAAATNDVQRKRARVWVLRDGTPHPVSITIGLDDGDVVEVLAGDLKPGDKVIVNEVKPVEASTRPTQIQSPFAPAGGGGGGGRPRGMGRP
jgi:HlyD family secretion protein